MTAAYAALEAAVVAQPVLFADANQAALTAAVAWQFTQSMLADSVPAAEHPQLVRLSARLEETEAFRKYPPDGPGVPAP